MTDTNVNGYLLQIQQQIIDVDDYIHSDEFLLETTEIQGLYWSRLSLLQKLESILTQISEAAPV